VICPSLSSKKFRRGVTNTKSSTRKMDGHRPLMFWWPRSHVRQRRRRMIACDLIRQSSVDLEFAGLYSSILEKSSSIVPTGLYCPIQFSPRRQTVIQAASRLPVPYTCGAHSHSRPIPKGTKVTAPALDCTVGWGMNISKRRWLRELTQLRGPL